MSTSNTIVVNTVVQDRAVAVDSFGTPLILAYHENFVGVRSYGVSVAGLTDLIADGFSTTHDVYRKVQAMLAQDVHPSTVKVATRAAANAQEYTFTPVTTTVGYVYAFTVDCDGVDTEIEYTVQTSDTVALIATALQALLDAIAGVTATDNTGSVTIEPDDPEERIYLRDLPSSTIMTVADGSADAGIAADFAAALAADPDFYGVVADTTSAAEIAALAVAVAAAGKLGGADSVDSDNYTGDDGVAYTVAQTSNYRFYVHPTYDSKGQFAAGIMARQFAQVPGSSTWAHKLVSGAVADSFSQSELDNARDNGGFVYFYESGISHTLDGKSCGGRYLDTTRGIDWLNSVIHANMLTVMISHEKINYTDSGAALFETSLRQALASAEAVGLLASGWTVTRGAVAAQSAADKAARRFPALSWDAVLAGAIHEVNPVSGTVTL